METGLTIQQVAELTGLSVHTLRYYERNELLEPVNRAENGHRRYLAEDVARVEFLTRLRATGMPIRQMRQFATLFREKPGAIAERRAILEAHERQVQEHILELSQNLAIIQWKIQHYKELEARYPRDESTSYQNERSECLAAGKQLMLKSEQGKSEALHSETADLTLNGSSHPPHKAPGLV